MRTEAKVIGALISAMLLSTGCSYNPFTSNSHETGSPVGVLAGAGVGGGAMLAVGAPKPYVALGALGGGALGYYATTLRFDSGGVVQAGGQVYKVGQLVGIYIPTDKLFEPNTADFLPQASAILDSAATVLARYPDNNILISGNTSGFGRPRWERKLSQQRAQKVAAYLWDSGINNFKNPGTDLRRLSYVGYGDYFPISQTLTNDGIRLNSRIQITSYPSNCDLGLGKRNIALHNFGALNDNDDLDDKHQRCTPDANNDCNGLSNTKVTEED